MEYYVRARLWFCWLFPKEKEYMQRYNILMINEKYESYRYQIEIIIGHMVVLFDVKLSLSYVMEQTRYWVLSLKLNIICGLIIGRSCWERVTTVKQNIWLVDRRYQWLNIWRYKQESEQIWSPTKNHIREDEKWNRLHCWHYRSSV